MPSSSAARRPNSRAQGHAVVHGHAGHGHEGADVEGAHAGVLAVMRAHVDAGMGHAGGGQRPLHHRLRPAHERVDGAVRGAPGIDVEERAAGGAPDRVRDGVDDRRGRGPPRSSERTPRASSWVGKRLSGGWRRVKARPGLPRVPGASILVSWRQEATGPMYVNTRPDMPQGVTTLPARYYTDPAHFQLEMERIHFDMWLCAGRTEQVAAPGRYFLRQVGNASVVVLGGRRRTRLRLPQRVPASGHAPVPVRGRPAPRPHPVLLPRVDVRPGRPAPERPAHGEGRGVPGGRLSAAAGGHRGLGRPRLHQPLRTSQAVLRAPRRAAREVRALGDGRPPPGGAARLRAEGELEAHHPELLGVPALPDRAPAPQPAVALHERGQRAAPADVPGRADGPARRGEDADHGRPDDARRACPASAPTTSGTCTTTRSCPTSS